MENEKSPSLVEFLGIVDGTGARVAELQFLGLGQGNFLLLTDDGLRRRIADLKIRSINTDPEETALLALHEEPGGWQFVEDEQE